MVSYLYVDYGRIDRADSFRELLELSFYSRESEYFGDTTNKQGSYPSINDYSRESEYFGNTTNKRGSHSREFNDYSRESND